MFTVEVDWWLTDILISSEGSAVTDFVIWLSHTPWARSPRISSRLMQVGEEFCGSKSEVLQEAIKWQSVNYFKHYHRWEFWAETQELKNSWQDACGPLREDGQCDSIFNSRLWLLRRNFLWSHLLLESSSVSNNPPLCRLVITSHWAGSSFSSWLRNPLPTFGINLNIFWGESRRPTWLPVKTPRWGSLNATFLMSLISPTRDSRSAFSGLTRENQPWWAGVVETHGSAASRFTLKVRRPPPCPLLGLIDFRPVICQHALTAQYGWGRAVVAAGRADVGVQTWWIKHWYHICGFSETKREGVDV